MKLAIGILAHNEEGVIGATIASLLGQSVFKDTALKKQVIVVANGCADKTVKVARAALSGMDAHETIFDVLDIARAGKANAWNIFVHEASAPDADYFILLDADIEFATDDAIARLVDHLERHAGIEIAPDQPVKKFAGGGPMQLLIRALQKSGSDDRHAISGQLYAARAGALRAIRMPVGVVVEDGFLRAMILTAGFTAPEDKTRIIRAPEVRHYYAPYQSLSSIWRYERRQAAGTTINKYLYDAFQTWRRDGATLAEEIDRRNKATPDWLEALIAERTRDGGFILIPKSYVLRRWKRLSQLSGKDVLKAPLYAVAMLYDIAVAIDASRQLRSRARQGARWDAIRAG